MTDRYSRVTVVGTRRRLDTVLPSDEPVGRLLPDVLALLDEPLAGPARPRHLVTRGGRVLDGDVTLAGAGVPDGTLLDLVAVEDTPPAPVVHDVTEQIADALDGRAWRWGAAARRWTATAAVVVLVAVLTVLLRDAQHGRSGVVWLSVL